MDKSKSHMLICWLVGAMMLLETEVPRLKTHLCLPVPDRMSNMISATS